MGERKSLNKKSLTKYIAKIANISQRKAGIVLNTVLSVIKEDIVDNKKSSIPQIGSFIIKERKSRRYRNIRTGEIQNSIPRLSVVFRASSLLSNILNDLGKAKDNRSSEKKENFI